MSLGITLLAVKEVAVFEGNITHNLVEMTQAAGIYEHIWRPEELGITKAGELITPLKEGYSKLKANPKKFKKYDASNEWGTYNDFLPWVEKYLAACINNPEARIKSYR